ncbi:uncharacterized protein A4U43_C04F11910 [Asparagus officinalis]|uniref:Uncharacterized protein n=1 Tax=Asparagus officinalis TaxID=4686 RepID=A0A5P1F1Z8_ASPOF|nr:uncharacterized protein A4U43_C04F11910 [Asparagus officinalis]
MIVSPAVQLTQISERLKVIGCLHVIVCPILHEFFLEHTHFECGTINKMLDSIPQSESPIWHVTCTAALRLLNCFQITLVFDPPHKMQSTALKIYPSSFA